MEKICKYHKCRHEVKEGSDYCKYHLRMIEIEENMSPQLKEALEKTRKERYPEDTHTPLKSTIGI